MKVLVVCACVCGVWVKVGAATAAAADLLTTADSHMLKVTVVQTPFAVNILLKVICL